MKREKERGRVAGLRKGAHGRQRGGGGGGTLRVEMGIGARRNAQRPRVPGHRQDSAATAFSRVPGEAATASSVAARFLVRWLKNAERGWNKIRSSIPYGVWASCRDSVNSVGPFRAGCAIQAAAGKLPWKTLEAVRLIQWIKEAEEARSYRALSLRHCSTMAALKN